MHWKIGENVTLLERQRQAFVQQPGDGLISLIDPALGGY